MEKNPVKEINIGEDLAKEIFMPAFSSAIAQAAAKTDDGDAVINGFVNSFSLVLIDLMQSNAGAAGMLSALAKHIAEAAASDNKA